MSKNKFTRTVEDHSRITPVIHHGGLHEKAWDMVNFFQLLVVKEVSTIGSTFKAMISLVVFLSVLGSQTLAGADCLTEVIEAKTVTANLKNDLTFDLTPSKDTNITSTIEQEFVNEDGVLKQDLEFSLGDLKLDPAEKFRLRNDIIVQAVSGEKYILNSGTLFQLEKSLTENYRVIVFAGKKLYKKEQQGQPTSYKLLKGQKIKVISPANSQIALKLNEPTVVKREYDPKTSSIGTTLEVEPGISPPEGYIQLTVGRKGFDFSRSQINVCMRVDDSPYQSSNDIQLIEVQPEKVILQARIPEDMAKLETFYLPKQADVLVAAKIPGSDSDKVLVMTKQLRISSQYLAIFIWVLAFAIPWVMASLLAALSSDRPEGFKGKGKFSHIPRQWRSYLNPIWMVSGKHGRASLSLAQILIWTILVFSASLYVLAVSGKLLELTDDVLVLLGFAGGASLIARITASSKESHEKVVLGAKGQRPKWRDLIQSDGKPDLYKFQLALFTALAAVFVFIEIIATMQFPQLPPGLLSLIGISNGVYLTAKATGKTVFQELAEIDGERELTEKKLIQLKEKSAELGQEVQKTQDRLDEAKNKGESAEVLELEKQLDELKKSQKAADDAVTEAKLVLDKLQKDLADKKEEALKQS